MLHFRQENDVTRLEVFIAPGMGDEVDAVGGPGGEDDFSCFGGIKKLSAALSGRFVGKSSPHRKGVNAAVDVSVVALVIIYQSIDNTLRFLGRGRIIEVDERLAVNLLIKDREIGANILPGGIHVLLVAWFFGGRGLRVAFGCIESRMPAEGGAFNPGRELMNAGEGCEIRHIIIADLPGGDHLVEMGVDHFGLGDSLALEVDGHERGTGFGYGTPTPLETDIADPVAIELHVDSDLIAAHRVVATPDAVGAGQHRIIPWAAVVV